MRRFAASFTGWFSDDHVICRAQSVHCLRICLLLSIGAIGNGQAAARDRTLVDADWRFHLGEVSGYVLASPGIPVTQWIWIADATAPKDAGVMAAPGLNTSGWSNITAGTDVFNGSQGAAWYRATRAIVPTLRKQMQLYLFQPVCTDRIGGDRQSGAVENQLVSG